MRVGRFAIAPLIDCMTTSVTRRPYLVSFVPLHVVRKYLSSGPLAPSSSASSVLIRDELLCSSIMAYTRWTVCGFSLLDTSTNSSLLHETPPSIALHVDVHFESTASPLWVGNLVVSLCRRAGWRLSLHMLHSMLSLQLLAVSF